MYFVVIIIPEPGGVATGTWNGPIPESHAHDEIGPFRRKGNCWISRRARICMWTDANATEKARQADRALRGTVNGRCDLVVKGKTYMSGPCTRNGDDPYDLVFEKADSEDEVQTVSVSRGEHLPSLLWTSDVDREEIRLNPGSVKLKGNCWISKTVKFCFRR